MTSPGGLFTTPRSLLAHESEGKAQIKGAAPEELWREGNRISDSTRIILKRFAYEIVII